MGIIKFLLSIWFLCAIAFLVVKCNDGRVGGISPNKPYHEFEMGTELVLTCTVNITFNCSKINESDRGFTFEFRNQTGDPSEYITQLNSSAIELRIPNVSIMKDRIKCYCNKDAIDLAYVGVGTKPQNVTDFDCIGYNFEYLQCSFSESQNPVIDNYLLEYSISNEHYIYDCPLYANNNKWTCYINGSVYYQVHEHYNFTLKSNNSLGTIKQSFFLNQIDKMKPATPNLTLVKSTSDSLTFTWTYLRARQFKTIRDYSLIFEIKYLPELNKKEKNDDDFILYNGTISDTKTNMNYTIKLENLEYAYTWYDIRVRLRVKSPKVKETPWSDTCKIISQTDSRIPDSAPKTDIGSFYIDDSNHKLNLYWETLPSYRKNGKNTRYIIKNIFENGLKTNISALKEALNTATYRYNSSNTYEFHIKSVNERGESPNYSVIKIMSREKYLKDNYLPKYFNKIFHNNSYELTWEEPVNANHQLQDYTVFWCKSTQESHTDCENSDEGSIHFERVDKSQLNFTKPKINIDYHLNFGVSANYKQFSSGIVWAPCTGRKTGDFDEVQFLSAKAEKQTIAISWNLDCVYRPILKGYNLTYCPYTENPNGLAQGIEPNCTESEKFVIIPKNKAPGEYVLENLKPYKSYKININMFSETKSGPKLSKLVYATTSEAAPTSPRNLKLVNKTSNYATIQWDVPENKNGDIRYYEIFYNENNRKLEKVKIPENVSAITYRLEHLKSFHNYKVYVTAFTVAPSNRSNDITFKTWIGQPDSLKIGKPGLENSSGLKVITWDPPVDRAADKTSFYKITINSNQGGRGPFQVVSFVEQNKCTLRPDCKTFEIKAEVKGSAVNAIPREEFDFERFEHITFPACGNPNSNQTFHTLNDHEIRDLIDESFDEADFFCIEDIRNVKEKFSNIYCATQEYKFLAGNDEPIYGFECNLEKKELTQTVLLVIITLPFMCAFFALLFFGIKKFKKMKNIDVVLPPGLADLNQLETTKGNQGKPLAERQHIEKANENLHLLSSFGENGSTGYLHCSESEKSYDVNSNNDVICNNDDGQSCTQSGNSEEISDVSNQSSHSSRSDLQSREDMNFIMSPNSILNNTNNMTSADGYVQQSVLQKNPPCTLVGNGYTVLENTNKPTIITNPMPTSSIDTSNYVNPCSIGLVAKPKIFLTSTTNLNNPTLAGYVTHKQLSDYGQQKRH